MHRARTVLAAFFTLAACGADAGPMSIAPVTLEDGPRLGSPRATHALIRVAGGELLAIGGCVEDGCDAGPASGTVDVISTDGSTLTGNGRLLERRVMPVAAPLPDGRALVVGGWVDGRPSATTEIFDPANGRSVPGPSLTHPRGGPTLVVLADGRVLIASAEDAEIFDPATGRLEPAGRLNTPRGGATGTLLPDGKVLIAGGSVGEGAGRPVLADAELFDPIAKKFTPTGSMRQGRHKHAAVALPNGDVLVIGGSTQRDYQGKLRSVERYLAAEGRFVPAGELAVERFKIGDGVLLIGSGTVLVAAGAEHPELFDIAAGKGALLPEGLGANWNFTTLARIGKRSALLAGGYSEGSIELTDRSWIFRF